MDDPPTGHGLLAPGPSGVTAHHELLERIGAGGAATVCRARRSDGSGPPLAVKILHRALLDAGSRRAFERECRALERLAGAPGIVAVRDFGVDPDGQAWIVLDLCEGTLAERLRSLGRLHPDEVIDIGTRLAGALAAAHALGIVHGDVKPGNVFVDAAGHAVLGDFGASVDLERTLTGSLSLSLAYAAPETVARGEVGVRSDLYGLGATLHHLLSGRTPFDDGEPRDDGRDHDGDDGVRDASCGGPGRPENAWRDGGEAMISLGERVKRITRGEPVPLAGAPGPAALHALIGELLALEPGDRPADARSVGERLGALAASPKTIGGASEIRSAHAGAQDPTRHAGPIPRAASAAAPAVPRPGAPPTTSSTALPAAPPTTRPGRLVAGGAFALALVGALLAVARPPPTTEAAACGTESLLCESFDGVLDGWKDERDPRVARLETTPDGWRGRALTLFPTDLEERGGSQLARRLPAPPPGQPLRIRLRVRVEQSSPAYFWMNLLQLSDDRGRFWSLGIRHFTHPEIMFDLNHGERDDTEGSKADAARAHPFDAWLCVELVIDPKAGSALGLHVDGALVAEVPRALSAGSSRHFRVAVGSSSMQTPATAPIVHVDELRAEASDAPLCPVPP